MNRKGCISVEIVFDILLKTLYVCVCVCVCVCVHVHMRGVLSSVKY